MAELSVSSQTITNATVVVKMAGDMDSGNFGLVEEEFNKLLDSGIRGIVLDLSEVDMLSSSGIGAFIDVSRLLETRKGRLILAAARPKIAGLLEMLGVEESFAIVDTAEQARKMIASIKTVS